MTSIIVQFTQSNAFLEKSMKMAMRARCWRVLADSIRRRAEVGVEDHPLTIGTHNPF